MAQAAVAAKIHQALDVHLNFAAQVTFNGEICVDMFTNCQNFGVAQLVHTAGGVDANSFADGFGRRRANSGDISKGDWYPLCSGDIHAGDTCHVIFPFVAVP